MKTFCKTCGCHFPDEFDQTINPACSFWPAHGVPHEFIPQYKDVLKRVWDHSFALDVDFFAEYHGLIITPSQFSIQPVQSGGIKNEFEMLVSGYKEWPEDKRKRFQKDWYKYFYSGQSGNALLGMFGEHWVDPGSPVNPV